MPSRRSFTAPATAASNSNAPPAAFGKCRAPTTWPRATGSPVEFACRRSIFGAFQRQHPAEVGLPMIDIRPFDGLAHRDHGWLDTRYHFSFSDYQDPSRMGWGKLRVWNDDKIGPKSGFPPHPHSDMEIITFVRTGAITHKDSLGNTGRTGAGDV